MGEHIEIATTVIEQNGGEYGWAETAADKLHKIAAALSSGSRPAPSPEAIEAATTIRREAANLAHDYERGERQCCADLARRIGKGIRALPVETFLSHE